MCFFYTFFISISTRVPIGTYWEVYPDKKPDIIAIECYDGLVDYRVARSWLYEYANGEFGAD